jgi:hypothetical protein
MLILFINTDEYRSRELNDFLNSLPEVDELEKCEECGGEFEKLHTRVDAMYQQPIEVCYDCFFKLKNQEKNV